MFYSVTCIYVSKDDNLVLDNRLLCSSRRKTISVALSIPQRPIVLFVLLRPYRLSPYTLMCLFLLSLFSSCLEIHVGETMSIFSAITRKHSLRENSRSSASYNLSIPHDLWVLELFCRCIQQDQAPQLYTLIGCGFLYSSPFVEKRTFLDKGYTSL